MPQTFGPSLALGRMRSALYSYEEVSRFSLLGQSLHNRRLCINYLR